MTREAYSAEQRLHRQHQRQRPGQPGDAGQVQRHHGHAQEQRQRDGADDFRGAVIQLQAQARAAVADEHAGGQAPQEVGQADRGILDQRGEIAAQRQQMKAAVSDTMNEPDVDGA